MFLIFFVFLAVCGCLVKSYYNTEEYYGDYCEPQSGGVGICVSFKDCQPLIDLATKKNRTAEDIDLIKKSKCERGYDYDSFYVCCPVTEPKIKTEDVTCDTPDGKSGACIPLNTCPHLASLLKPPIAPLKFDYLKKSSCEGPEYYWVCCGPPPALARDVVIGDCENRISAFPPDPLSQCCGVDKIFGNEIVLGNATSIDDYPWLVIIEYVKKTTKFFNCGGTLISGKYVLTAGHCVVGPQLQGTKPIRVHLGEYDIDQEDKDCMVDKSGRNDCTHGVTRIYIEETIPYPLYNPVGQKRHDIALIRLKEMAPFTDFIRPICLPEMDLTLPENLPSNFIAYVAGWGIINGIQKYSQLKMHAELPYVELSKCQRSYSNRDDINITLWEGQVCAGGDGRDTCKGDSGGPLIFENKYEYEIIGIASFGQRPCGRIDTPGVFTKVYHYHDWIKSTIVP